MLLCISSDSKLRGESSRRERGFNLHYSQGWQSKSFAESFGRKAKRDSPDIIHNPIWIIFREWEGKSKSGEWSRKKYEWFMHHRISCLCSSFHRLPPFPLHARLLRQSFPSTPKIRQSMTDLSFSSSYWAHSFLASPILFSYKKWNMIEQRRNQREFYW